MSAVHSYLVSRYCLKCLECKLCQGEIPFWFFSSFYNPETLIFVVSPSDLNQIGQIFILRNHKFISEFYTPSEYFTSVGDRSYFD